MITIDKKSIRKDNRKYLIRFVFRSFFVAILSLIIISSLLCVALLGDVYYHTKKGDNVIPLFAGYIIVTPSMVPTIKVNDAVVVKRIDDNSLTIGDIITFKSNDERYKDLVVTHRIVGEQSLSSGSIAYRTKGDNNKIEDLSVVPKSCIYGKVMFKIPKLGYVKSFLNKPIGFLTFIILPVFLIIILNYKSVKKEKFI